MNRPPTIGTTTRGRIDDCDESFALIVVDDDECAICSGRTSIAPSEEPIPVGICCLDGGCVVMARDALPTHCPDAAQRRARRDHLAATGSHFSAEGECGRDQLPCGVCDECLENGVVDAA